MKQQKTFLSLLWMLVSLSVVSCTDYPDEIGFDAEILSNDVSVTDCDLSSYSARATCSFIVPLDGVAPSTAGFMVREYTTEGEVETRYTAEIQPGELVYKQVSGGELEEYGRKYTFSCDWKDLSYATRYEVTPYLASEGIVLSGTPRTQILAQTTENFIPRFSGSPTVQVVSNSLLRVTVGYMVFGDKQGVTDYSATLNDVSLPVKLDPTEGLFTADIDIARLPEGNYSNLELKISNLFGESVQTNSLDLTVQKAQQTYADDGRKSDCIRLCGVNWATGNFCYYNDQALIAGSQYAYKVDNEYFTFGSTGLMNRYYSRYWDGSEPLEIQGNAEYDVVAAHLPGWCMPSVDNALALQNASTTYCYVDRENSSYKGQLFLPAANGKIFVSKVPLVVSSASLEGDWLFLPARGRVGTYNYAKPDNMSWGQYMLSSRTWNDHGNGVSHSIIAFYEGGCYLTSAFYDPWYQDYWVYSNNKRVSIRPVKQ